MPRGERGGEPGEVASDGGGAARRWRALWRFFRPVLVVVGVAVFLRLFVVQLFVIPTDSMAPTLLVGDAIVVDKISYGLYLPFVERRVIEWGQPRRGDLVVFQRRRGGKDYVKRLVAVAGDTVRLEDNVLHIGGDAVTGPRAWQMSRCFEGEEPAPFDPADRGCRCVRRSEGAGGVDAGAARHTVQHLSRGCPGGRPGWPPTFPLGWEDAPRADGAVVVPDGFVFVMGDNRDRSRDSRAWGFVPRARVKGVVVYRWYSAYPGRSMEVPR